MFFVALKDKKALTVITKENQRFKQLRLNYLNKKPNKKQNKTKATQNVQLRLVIRVFISSIRVGAVSSVLEGLSVFWLMSF